MNTRHRLEFLILRAREAGSFSHQAETGIWPMCSSALVNHSVTVQMGMGEGIPPPPSIIDEGFNQMELKFIYFQ